jgi:L-seryl-tRNA(Ser) seleniumtransferase
MADKSDQGKVAKKKKIDKPSMRNFPSVSSILEDDRIKCLNEYWSFTFVAFEVKKLTAARKRKAISENRVPSKDDLVQEIESLFDKYRKELIQPVINGTGMILHTNLGRAPISATIYEGLLDAVTGYSNLEFDLNIGKRSNRSRMIGRLLAVLSGAESGMAVNNNAAAVYLAVANLAGAGKEVIISRGQLVQIGGGFRIPEIIERSGSVLREIGTTNKTSLADYMKAINKKTGLVLIVHKSNFVQRGFTEEPETARIVELAKSKKVAVCYDLGSGLINNGEIPGQADEPTVFSAVRSGADLVCFSGDKLLGGPQAGLLVGKEKLISKLLKDPLYRAFRLDKLTIGLLENTLLGHLREIPLPCWEMASQSLGQLKLKADEIIGSVNNSLVTTTSLKSSFGGGSLPEFEFDSIGIKITGDPLILAKKLLNYSPPVVCRTVSNGILIDLRTVMPEYYQILTDIIKSCLL